VRLLGGGLLLDFIEIFEVTLNGLSGVRA